MGKELKEIFNKNLLLVAILVVLIVFIISYFSIILYDNKKRVDLQDEFAILNQQIGMEEIYSFYLSKYPEKECEILKKQLDSQLKINSSLYQKLKQYNENAIVNTDNVIKYQFVITNLKLWIQYNKLKSDCNSAAKVMLYFYPEINDNTIEKIKEDAKTVVFENKLRKIMNDCGYLSIALPDKSGLDIIEFIKQQQGIIDSPSAIINNEIYYDINFDSEFYEKINCNK